MNLVVSRQDAVVTVALSRGKVNAIGEDLVDDLIREFAAIEADPTARAVVLTGSGNFFCFGFDIPHFLDYPPDRFTNFVLKFSRFYIDCFTFPKPVIGALNGHATAGGCVLATACDHRIMASGKAKIALNEIAFGSSVFYGISAMLAYCVGLPAAQKILFSGDMYSAEEALAMGLVDKVTEPEKVLEEAQALAASYAAKNIEAFRVTKDTLKGNIGRDIRANDPDSIREFVKVWYSEELRKNLVNIKIR